MMPARDIRAQGGRSGALNINHKLCLGRERQRVSEEKRKKEKKIYNRLGWWRQPNSDEIEQDGIKNRTRRALGVTVCVCVWVALTLRSSRSLFDVEQQTQSVARLSMSGQTYTAPRWSC